MGRNKVQHAHYIRINVVNHAQCIISRPTSERADITVLRGDILQNSVFFEKSVQNLVTRPSLKMLRRHLGFKNFPNKTQNL